MQNSPRPILIWLHWIMFIMIAAVYVTMEFRGIFDRDTLGRTLMLTTHYLLGLSIMVLAVFRFLTWVATPKPETESYGKFQQVATKMMFLALYALMIVMPVLGWTDLSAYGVNLNLLGWSLPALLEPNDTLARQLSDIHIIFGKVGYFLIGLHACAALFHHFVKRDDTLNRMLKFRR